MGTVSKRGDRLRAEVCVNGIRDSKTFGSKERMKARAWIARRESEMRDGKGISDRVMTLRDVMIRYRDEVSPQKRGATRWEKLRFGVWLEQDWTAVKLKHCTTEYLGRWRDDRLKEEYRGKQISPSTVLREMSLLSNVFTVATVEWKLFTNNPMKGVRRPAESHHRERLLSDDEIAALCEAMEYSDDCDFSQVRQRVAAAMLLAIETCMRAGELCSLRPETVHLDKRYARLEMTKNGEPRNVPLSSRAIAILERVGCNLNITPSQIDSNFRKYRDKLGIENLHFHDTRHTAITRIANSRKLDVLELAKMTGHKDLHQLRAYFNETAENIAKRLD